MLQSLLKLLGNETTQRLVRENFRAQRGNYGISIIAMVVIAVTTALTAYIMKDIIDTMIGTDNRARVFAVAGAVALIFLVKGAATYVQVVFLSRAGNGIVAAQQRKLYDRILEHGVAFFSEDSSSNLLMRVTQSANMARQVIDTIVMSFVRDLLTLVGLIIVMVTQQPTLTFFSLIFGPLAILGMRKILSKVKGIVEAELASLAEIMKVIQETSAGIRVVKAFALEQNMTARMNTAIRSVESRANAVARLEAMTSPLMETLSGFAIAAVVALSAVSLFGEATSSPGQLMSFVTALLMAYEPAKRLARMRVTIEAGMTGVSMMYQILDEPITVVEADAPQALPADRNDVAFRGVSFRYGEAQQILTDLDIRFEAGKTTALVGPSGGGKSTVINLIMRLYDPTKGQVTIGGMDLRDASFASLRRKIAFVGQDTFLFSGTIRHNIALGREDATEAQIEAAAQNANAHDFIMALPKGYDTEVGENGAGLSGGQRQRIAIARAILRDSPILLMDEATSALDAESEHLVKEALHELTRGRTTVVIAHRLSTVLEADKIIVLDQGRVAEEGSVAELLSRDGLFRKLYNRQFAPRSERQNDL